MPTRRIEPVSSERHLQATGWRVPEVALDGPRLRWRYGPPGLASTKRRATRGLLERFIRLADPRVRPERIEAFARTAGVFHHERGPGPGAGVDSIDKWRETARFFGAIVGAGADLRAGRWLPAEPHWQHLARALDFDLEAAANRRGLLMLAYRTAIHLYVLPSVELQAVVRSDGTVSIQLGGGSLLGALAGELLRMLQGQERELSACAACGDLHQPRGQAGRRSFCTACRASGAPVRLAKRDLASRRARARAAASRGASPEEAALAAYGRPAKPAELARVRGWIEAR
jgi:hypothetical protein